jgi:hypothetical protein
MDLRFNMGLRSQNKNQSKSFGLLFLDIYFFGDGCLNQRGDCFLSENPELEADYIQYLTSCQVY